MILVILHLIWFINFICLKIILFYFHIMISLESEVALFVCFISSIFSTSGKLLCKIQRKLAAFFHPFVFPKLRFHIFSLYQTIQDFLPMQKKTALPTCVFQSACTYRNIRSTSFQIKALSSSFIGSSFFVNTDQILVSRVAVDKVFFVVPLRVTNECFFVCS